MRKSTPTVLVLIFLLVVFVYYFAPTIPAQTRQRTVGSGNPAPQRGRPAGQTSDEPAMSGLPANVEVLKVDVDLVVIDALVMQRNTARVIGDLKKEDFLLSE